MRMTKQIIVYAVLQSEQFTDGELLTNILKTAIEKVFFTQIEVVNIDVRVYENPAIQEKTNKS